MARTTGEARLRARSAQPPACGSRCGIARRHPAGCGAIGLARRSTRDGRRARSRSPCPAPLPRTDQCPLERCDPEPRRLHSRGSACGSRSRIARRTVTGSRSRRLRRTRRRAGGTTREPWVGDRSRTGTRATTRVRRRSLGREPVTLRPTRKQARNQARARESGQASGYAGSIAPTRQRNSSPARSGTIVASPKGSDSGTRHDSRCRVIDSPLRGNP